MSYNVSLRYGENIAKVEPYLEGNTSCGHRLDPKDNYYIGSASAELNITYNFSVLFKQNLDKEGINWLHNKKAIWTIERLELAVERLCIQKDENPWKSTPGNAGYALSILLGLAREHPNSVWYVLG